MNIIRVEEIMNSSDIVSIAYNGQEVWVESIDKEFGTAKVNFVNSGDSLVVDANQLNEMTDQVT